MRTKDQIIGMQLNELQRLERRALTYVLANSADLNVSVVEGLYEANRCMIECIKRTIREVPDGA